LSSFVGAACSSSAAQSRSQQAADGGTLHATPVLWRQAAGISAS
jgi:hypothetical protein